MRNPLEGVRVIEIGQMIAGPFATKIMSEFGAEVIKIEPPKRGDAIRNWRVLHNGTSLWWYVQSRNKKSVTFDLRDPEMQDVFRELVKEVDVVVANFNPSTLERWKIDWESLRKINPRLVMLCVSGYGQTGPYRNTAGFGVVGEAMGGLRYLSGEPGQVPVRVGISIGDSLSALHGVIGVLLALRARDAPGGSGQMVDVALYESVFNMMESTLPEYATCGVIREPAGSRLPGIAPTSAYPTKDGRFVLIAGNGDSIFKRLMEVVGRSDLAQDPELATNEGRVARVEELDAAIGAWSKQHTEAEVIDLMTRSAIPAGKIYTIEDIVADPQYQARDMILDAELPDGTATKVPGIVPKLSETPGRIYRNAPALGQDTVEVLQSFGIDSDRIARWGEKGLI